MKNLSAISLMLIFSLTTHSVSAKIWRVNNMTGVTADFNNLQSAYDAATAGDTIHIEPSVNNYSGVSSYKRLVWLSVGDFLTQNPGNQFTNYPSYISYLNFYTGSEGSVVSARVGNLNINSNEISIIRSSIGGSMDINSSNCVVLQSYVNGRIGLNGTNNVISNNIIANGLTMDYNTSSAVITNNIFNRTIYAYVGFSYNNISIKNSVFQNNISILGQITFDAFNSTFSNNMCPDNSFPAGNGNLRNVDMSTVFENPNGTSDKDMVTKAGSPSIGVGYGGGDLGPFGGSTPYKLALQPAIPAITNISTPSSTGANTIQVTISAKSNN
jgi:hypothetical protein